MPPDSGMAFVLVQHLAPDHKSMMAELLSRHTAMTVKEAEDGAQVRANQIFVIPPNATLTIKRGILRVVRPALPRQHRWPINDFFSSLAEDQGERAVCIVLSGTGTDGTLGLRKVKEHGGFTLAQAEVDHVAMSGMPQSAAATGLVDQVMLVEAMPARLIEHQRHMIKVATRKNGDGTRHDAAEHLSTITTLLHAAVGHDFSQYKRNTLVRRVQRRMQVLRLDTVPAFIDRLQKDPHELELLFRDLLIGVTQFFRDPDTFETLQTTAISGMLATAGSRVTLRIWIPGCSTGEEVYSIAILLQEEMDRRRIAPKIQIFGTDIDEKAVTIARAARYPKTMSGMSPARIRRWFVEDGDEYSLIRKLREMCVFSLHNVVKDPPFSKLDMISCRNLLIYMGADLQKRAMQTFHYALKPGGILFLGPSEGIVGSTELFAALDKKHRLYRRRDTELPTHPPIVPKSAARPPTRRTRAAPMSAADDDRFDKNARSILEKYSPAYVVIDRQHEILRYSGDEAARYFELSAGPASLNLFAVLRRELRPVVRAAIRKAFVERKPIVPENVVAKIDGRNHSVTVIAAPLGDDDADAGLCLVAFQDRGPIAKSAGANAEIGVVDVSIRAMELELQTTRTQLQAAIDEREASGEEARSTTEEYQSVNEELQSTNEELETAKEEMQSINEELQTINTELNSKNELLTRLNSDLQNLLESTAIATIFLDREMRIKSFTPAMVDLFHLQDGDQGRQITDIVSRLSYHDLRKDFDKVLRELGVVEHEVQIADRGKTFIMRIRPYRTIDQVIDGVVITYVDNTAHKLEEIQRTLLLQELNHRVKNALATVQSIAMQTFRTATSPEAFREAFEARLLALANTHDLLTAGEWKGAALGDLVDAELMPYQSKGQSRWTAEGPIIQLDSKTALALAMTLHELATNAAKYGALSAPDGRVEVTWKDRMVGNGRRLRLLWIEKGGPAVGKPTRQGFGTRLVAEGLAYELDGNVQLDFASAGVRCTIDVPLQRAEDA